MSGTTSQSNTDREMSSHPEQVGYAGYFPAEQEVQACYEQGDAAVRVLPVWVRVAQQWKMATIQITEAKSDCLHVYRVQFRWVGAKSYLIYHNTVSVTYYQKQDRVRFGPRSSIEMEWDTRGLGVGAFLLAQCIEWARMHYSAASVHDGKLADWCVDTDDERDRRNQFYRTAGFDLCFANDESQRCGRFTAKSVAQLRAGWNQAKVSLVAPPEPAEPPGVEIPRGKGWLAWLRSFWRRARRDQVV